MSETRQSRVHEDQNPQRFPSTSSSLVALRSRGIPISTVLDVGVQHGSPELCKACPDIPHILFEPVAEFQNSIAYNYRDIPHELVASAVSDRDGEALLEVSGIVPGFSVSHSSIIEDGSQRENTRRVPMVTIDSFLAGRPDVASPYLLKIDIDGLEIQVLNGAKKRWKSVVSLLLSCMWRGIFSSAVPSCRTQALL
jgi:FkbM family methyltransferase